MPPLGPIYGASEEQVNPPDPGGRDSARVLAIAGLSLSFIIPGAAGPIRLIPTEPSDGDFLRMGCGAGDNFLWGVWGCDFLLPSLEEVVETGRCFFSAALCKYKFSQSSIGRIPDKINTCWLFEVGTGQHFYTPHWSTHCFFLFSLVRSWFFLHFPLRRSGLLLSRSGLFLRLCPYGFNRWIMLTWNSKEIVLKHRLAVIDSTHYLLTD